MNTSEIRELKEYAIDIREQIIHQLATLGSGHFGGSMSIADIVAVLYGREMNIDPKNPKKEDRDMLVCSKGHAGPALYAALALKGFFPMEELETLNKPGTILPSHCDRLRTPGIDMTAGSLGQGLSCACGIAMAALYDGGNRNVYCIVGDGESQEGQIWEAVLFAAQFKLDNLILLIDYNKAQLDGYIKDVNEMADYVEKFKAFHWETDEVDGHDVEALSAAIERAKAGRNGKPHVIVCNTVKGSGVSLFAPDRCHHITLSKEQAEQCMQELEAARAAL